MNDQSPSLARDFFEHLKADGNPQNAVSRIKALINSTPLTFENEWRDFKGEPKFDDIPKIWSKALSGFANTGGGVLVWGIDCRNVGGIDAAQQLRLAKEPAKLLSRLKELLPEATNPPIRGVELEYLIENTSSGEGFVLCHIPESSHKPHRAEFAERNYFIRVGDRFEIAPVSLLRSLFFPETGCDFEVDGGSSIVPREPHKRHELTFSYNIFNNGTGSAYDVVMLIRHFNDGMMDEYRNHWDISSGRSGSRLSCRHPIHPGEIVPAFGIVCGTVQYDPVAKVIAGNCPSPTITFHVYAKDFAPIAGSIIFTRNEIENSLHKRAQPIPIRYR